MPAEGRTRRSAQPRGLKAATEGTSPRTKHQQRAQVEAAALGTPRLLPPGLHLCSLRQPCQGSPREIGLAGTLRCRGVVHPSGGRGGGRPSSRDRVHGAIVLQLEQRAIVAVAALELGQVRVAAGIAALRRAEARRDRQKDRGQV